VRNGQGEDVLTLGTLLDVFTRIATPGSRTAVADPERSREGTWRR
jgi:hypothetical protein